MAVEEVLADQLEVLQRNWQFLQSLLRDEVTHLELYQTFRKFRSNFMVFFAHAQSFDVP
jgi:hypothetical protein